MKVWYACSARVGLGRCRTHINVPEGTAPLSVRCNEHRRAPRAEAPKVLLLGCWMTAQLGMALEDLGVKRITPDWAVRDAAHEARSAKLGVDAHAFRKVADTGCPVFGDPKRGGGLKNVGIRSLLREVRRDGYVVTDLHIEQARGGNADILRIALTQGGVPTEIAPPALADAISDYLGGTWGKVDLWANPPREDGVLTHTVNCRSYKDEAPEAEIAFAAGLYSVSFGDETSASAEAN